jgi:hypothetical protein
MNVDVIKNCFNVDLEETKRLKNELSNLYDNAELNRGKPIKDLMWY